MTDTTAHDSIAWRATLAVLRRMETIKVANGFPFDVTARLAEGTLDENDLPAAVVVEGDETPEGADGSKKSMQQQLEVVVEGHIPASGEHSDARALSQIKAAIKRAALSATDRHLKDQDGNNLGRIALRGVTLGPRAPGQAVQVVIVSFAILYLEGYGDPTRVL